MKMNKRSGGYLILAAVISLLFYGCGSSHGGGGGAAASATTLTSDKTIALANGDDPVSPERATLTATSTPGSPITFVITAGTGSLVNPDAATNASGIATVQLQRNPLTGVNTREDITVTATAAGASAAKTVRFINLPAQAFVSIALNRVIQDIGVLTFDLVSSPTQSAPNFNTVTPVGAATRFPRIASGPGTNTFAIWAGQGTSTYSLMTTAIPAITTRVNEPLLDFTYDIDPTIKSLPTFATLATGTTPSAITSLSSGAVPITVSNADFVATTLFSTDN
jgi:hypothetical protein